MKRRHDSPQLDLFLAAGNQNIVQLGFEKAMQAFEAQLILQTLERNDNNQSAAARELKMSKQLFNYTLQKIKRNLSGPKKEPQGEKQERKCRRA